LIRAQSIVRIDGQLVSCYRFRHILFQKYLYGSLDEVERVHLHEQVGTALEGLYSVQEQAAAIAVQLALHFRKAAITDKAIHYLHRAGQRAVQLSAYREAIAHLTRGLALLNDLPDPAGEDQRLGRAQQELALQLALGPAWQAGKGYGPEMENACTRARDLCQQTGETSQLCQVLGKLWTLNYVQAKHQEARKLAEEALTLAQCAGDPLHVALGHRYLGCILFCLGEYTTARAHLEHMIAFYDPHQHHGTLVALRGSDAGTSALAYHACCLWSLGYPDQALKQSQEALALARELGHPYSLAEVLFFAGCIFNRMRRDAQTLKGTSEELARLSSEKVPTWSGAGILGRGEALAMLGQAQEAIAQIRAGMADLQSVGVRCYLSGRLGSLGEARARAGQAEEGLTTLAEAFAVVEETGERHWEAELYRVRGELLLAQGDDAEAEASFHRAVEVARRQQARSWELRATTSLARLWQKQGKREEARRILAEIYGWFTEGFDTADLIEAKTLLGELSRSVR
jgi:predicted ATPase